jgi:lysophospholipase L1-like esterase
MRFVRVTFTWLAAVCGVVLLLGGYPGVNLNKAELHRPAPAGSPMPRLAIPPIGEQPHPLRMLFVGASITAGVGASDPSRGYAATLVALVQRQVGPVDTMVVAHSGAVAAEALKWDFPANQDLIVVHMGTNDFDHSTPLSAFQPAMHALFDRLRGGSPGASFVCLGVWAGATDVNKAGLHPGAYDSVVQSNCQGAGGSFVSLEGLFPMPALHPVSERVVIVRDARRLQGNSYVTSSEVGFHPNDTGHERIASAVFTVIESDHLLGAREWRQAAGLSRFA